MRPLLLVLLSLLACAIAYSQGQRNVRLHTVVVIGRPFYLGVFNGQCAWIEGGQACATEK